MGKGWEEGSSRMRGYTHTQRHTHTHTHIIMTDS